MDETDVFYTTEGLVGVKHLPHLEDSGANWSLLDHHSSLHDPASQHNSLIGGPGSSVTDCG